MATTKAHFRNKELNLRVPVRGSGFDVHISLLQKYERWKEEGKLIQRMFENIEKTGKPK